MPRMRSATPSPARPDPGATPAETLAAALARLAPEGPLGIALSGGGDSTALLLLTADWARAQGRSIAAATIDHGLRPGSRAEADAAGRLAASVGVAHEILTWEGAPEGNLQAAARAARIRLLGAWAARRGLAAVLTGHTRDDQAETVLLRLARGSGVDGLSGIPEVQMLGGTRVLRPLLAVPRAALRDWLTARRVAWIEDPSNDDPRFDRVRARRALEELGGLGITAGGLAATAMRLAAQRRVLEAAADALAARAVRWGALGEVWIDRAALGEAEADTALRVLAAAVLEIGGGEHRPRQEALARALADLLDARAGSLGGVLYEAAGDDALLSREPARSEGPVPARDGAVWDGRWHLHLAGPWPRCTLGALGEGGLSTLSRADAWAPLADWAAAPRRVRLAAPAIWGEGGLLAVPLAGYRHGTLPPGATARTARRPQAGPFGRKACP